jgi:hypothetical protein
VGLVFERDDSHPDVIRKIDALWMDETGGSKLLGITVLHPAMEQQVARVCSPLFYR